LSPEEVHQLGLDELASLQARMEPILKSIGYTKGTVGERMAAYKKHKAHHPESRPPLNRRRLAPSPPKRSRGRPAHSAADSLLPALLFPAFSPILGIKPIKSPPPPKKKQQQR
jgi:hypothetical protein